MNILTKTLFRHNKMLLENQLYKVKYYNCKYLNMIANNTYDETNVLNNHKQLTNQILHTNMPHVYQSFGQQLLILIGSAGLGLSVLAILLRPKIDHRDPVYYI